MIEVKVWRTPERGIYKFSIKGHAGYDEYGKDIVCAAVSAISQTAVLGIENIEGVKIRKKIEEGNLEVEIEQALKEIDRIKLQAILETMLLGLKDVAQGYSDYVKVEEV
ncbi:ribosomal-processing cysteine protease Prp [Caldanaerobacter sp.]|uniref:ribosomal-processing cysteine protease Prp n=1 Tax=Caldanaerobacter sp. TaxID=2930036 RepID=UPI003C754EBC